MPQSVLTTQQFLPYVAPWGSDFNGPVTNVDDASVHPEDKVLLPWTVDPKVSWLDYRCWVEVILDPGLALHKPLPQSDPTPDDLGVVDCQSPTLDLAKGGVPLTGQGVMDVIQRMASATYSFVLRGWGIRAGYQVPIPKLVKVGAALAIPDAPHRAFNVIIGNMCGIPVWFARWEKAYMIAGSPGQAQSPGFAALGVMGTQAPVPFNPALHIRPDAELPEAIRPPRAPLDRHAVTPAGQPANPAAGGIPPPPIGGVPA